MTPPYELFLALRYLLTRPINLLGVFGVTLGVYSHVTAGMQRDAANTVAAVIAGKGM